MNAPDSRGVGRDDRSPPAPPCGQTFGLRSTAKIRDLHLNRLAVVYVRRSTQQQVIENRESRERQYALARFAERLGWPAERVVVIDEDQGQSGKTADNRSGFQRLMTEVSLDHVGMVLGLELSRLSRSSKDWHQLVDVCGIFNTLLGDQDAIYDSLDSNDRLLLGMRGAMSEYELVTMRNRMLRGSRNKAERGELFLAVPVGYFKTPAGEVIQEPDEQARGMVRLVFEKFEELGSAYAVFRYLAVKDLQLGFRRQRGGRVGELEWRPASFTRILAILRHPIYAGAYAYGLHRPGKKDPATGRGEGGKWFLAPDEIAVLLRGRLPAYISWDRFLANQQRLRSNRSLPDAEGVARRGEALLPGLVVCGKCGRRLSTRYKEDRRPGYYCEGYWRSALEEPCGYITAAPLDELVSREVLRALRPAALDLSLHAVEDVERERQRLHEQWRQKLERARYEVDKAERQYHSVEPDYPQPPIMRSPQELVPRSLDQLLHPLLIIPSQAIQEAKQLVGRLIAERGARQLLQPPECLLLHRQVRLDVLVRRLRALVPQPERDHRDINSRLQQVHRRRVAQGVGGDPPAPQRRAVRGRPLHCLPESVLHARAGERAAVGVREQG
jgi:DNA invertase Pin-like site-specific DNA recombinase